ncbi:putative uncharacterized protein C1orf229 [Antechinus flavipes]|uniref:putative uncharacterized protein C1orf229 n=1 Tax=Antechinus flavipes TaxID=38775 RepID=UPI0022369962|nr:putative uncharacterized protein C1orf229 [Antechinus flavipes]
MGLDEPLGPPPRRCPVGAGNPDSPWLGRAPKLPAGLRNCCPPKDPPGQRLIISPTNSQRLVPKAQGMRHGDIGCEPTSTGRVSPPPPEQNLPTKPPKRVPAEAQVLQGERDRAPALPSQGDRGNRPLCCSDPSLTGALVFGAVPSGFGPCPRPAAGPELLGDTELGARGAPGDAGAAHLGKPRGACAPRAGSLAGERRGSWGVLEGGCAALEVGLFLRACSLSRKPGPGTQSGERPPDVRKGSAPRGVLLGAAPR